MNSSSTSSSERPVVRFGLAAGFVAGFVAILVAVNSWVRPPEAVRDIWYGPLIDAYASGYKANFLFLGTSRTRAAINPDAWDGVMSQVLHARTSTVNLGMGWCTPMEHWYGLHKLLSEFPDALRGTAVLLEAGDGIGYPERWDGNWIVDDRRDLLVPYMDRSDLPRLWKSSTPLEAKLSIAVDLLVPAFDQFPRLRHVVRSNLDSAGQGVVDGIWRKPTDSAAPSSDLVSAGGIRTDLKGVELARHLADSLSASDLKDQKPWRDWDSTVQADIVRLVKDAGGIPIFVRIPFSPIQTRPLRTPLREADRKRFQASLVRWGLPPLVEAEFATTADDFPDEWHLRKTLSPAFTQALALAYLQAFAPARSNSPPDTGGDSNLR
ncbi:MAG TPA: hypothetical protein VN931_10095 [Fibrobacteria bacterium]|nr:hypothetical protein [Fibrobacteria bacterium]